MSKEAMKLALDALAVKFSEGWHEGIKIDASDIMLLNDAAQALAEQPAKLEPVAWKWQQAPIRTAWGDDMAVASVAIDKDHTVDLYCEREQIAKVEVMFTSPPAQRKPLKLWTEAQHERAYRNSPELHKDVKSLAAFKRVAKEIAAMYGIKENT